MRTIMIALAIVGSACAARGQGDAITLTTLPYGNDEGRLTGRNSPEDRWNVELIGRWTGDRCDSAGVKGGVGLYGTDVSAYDVFVLDSYAYVAAWVDGLRVIDITNPTTPCERGFTETRFNRAMEVVVSVSSNAEIPGKYAYVADGYGLSIIYVSLPEFPSELVYVDSWAGGVDVSENFAYVVADSLKVLDVSVPFRPSQAGSYTPLTPIPNGNARSVTVLGSFAYMNWIWARNESETAEVLMVIDVSNPASPVEVAREDFWHSSGLSGIAVSGNYLYATQAWRGGGLLVFDISDPASLSQVAFYEIPGGSARDIAIAGKYAFVAAWVAGLRVLDISNPTRPIEVGFYDTQGRASRIALADGHIYVADREGGLYILRFDLPVMPAEVNIRPETLNLNSKGRWISAHIVLSEPFDVRDIDLRSIFLNDSIAAEQDYNSRRNDNDGDDTGLTVKFSRQAVVANVPEGEEVEIKVSGWVGDSYFEGLDTIRVVRRGSDVSQVDAEVQDIPRQFTLRQNYPNPFNPATTIRFDLAKETRVRLEVFTINGKLVRILMDRHLPQGGHKADWDGRDTEGRRVASGIYFYRLTTEHLSKARRMLLLK